MFSFIKPFSVRFREIFAHEDSILRAGHEKLKKRWGLLWQDAARDSLKLDFPGLTMSKRLFSKGLLFSVPQPR